MGVLGGQPTAVGARGAEKPKRKSDGRIPTARKKRRKGKGRGEEGRGAPLMATRGSDAACHGGRGEGSQGGGTQWAKRGESAACQWVVW